MMEIVQPLLAVAFGWGLKVLTDHLAGRKVEIQTLRKATFYLLKDWKALFDYERGTNYFRRDHPPIETFEPWRAVLQARFLEESEANSKSTSAAIELIASIDPPLATRLHNTLKNMAFAFRKDLGQVALQEEATYAGLLDSQDALVATTRLELEAAALDIAKRSGWAQRRGVQRWFKERRQGASDFGKGMDDQAELRARAFALEQKARGLK
jgi:hypothetical protein